MIKLKLCSDTSVIGGTIRATLTFNSVRVVNLISSERVSKSADKFLHFPLFTVQSCFSFHGFASNSKIPASPEQAV